jgi:hypothetical protein
MKIEEIWNDATPRDEAAFCRRFPDPVLVFPTSWARAESPVDVGIGKSGGTTAPSVLPRAIMARLRAAIERREAPASGAVKESVSPWAEWEFVFLTRRKTNAESRIITVGRSAQSDVQIDSATVSKVHASFAQDGESWVIIDAGSRNGTFVGGTRLQAATETRLTDGARIDFGTDLSAVFFRPQALLAFLKFGGLRPALPGDGHGTGS